MIFCDDLTLQHGQGLCWCLCFQDGCVCVPIRTPSIPWEIALLAMGCEGHQQFSQEYKSQTTKTFTCSALGVFGLMSGVLFFGG